MSHIREIEAADWPAVWGIIGQVFRRGDTYAISPSITEDEAREYRLERPQATFVAVNHGRTTSSPTSQGAARMSATAAIS